MAKMRVARWCVTGFFASLAFATNGLADGFDPLVSVADGVQIAPASVKAHTSRPPPGSVSENGDMKVWDTGGPVQVSPHLPNTNPNDFYRSSEPPLGTGGVIVDTRGDTRGPPAPVNLAPVNPAPVNLPPFEPIGIYPGGVAR